MPRVFSPLTRTEIEVDDAEFARRMALRARAKPQPAADVSTLFEKLRGAFDASAQASAGEIARLHTELAAARAAQQSPAPRPKGEPPAYRVQFTERDGNNRPRRAMLSPEDTASGAPSYSMDVDRDDLGRVRGVRLLPVKPNSSPGRG